jgi:arsenate reductase
MNFLFVCASNSVRSQIAEGWTRYFGDGTIAVRSAGLQPFMIHPVAIAVMSEVGIDISGQKLRRLDDRQLAWADYVITLSDTVKPFCAHIPGTTKYDHWPIPNPDALVNDDLSQHEAYAQVRDELQWRIEQLLKSINQE